ncbi:MAG: HD domain-containing protein [Candidatus Omnitrophota bacterium]|nr:HD domain-containing protein [Candidatus Omnitrophota bacterium]MDZ4241421.1 HD domain-containing protein [Candidatus Omnitrophota bacterium]
MGKLILLMKRFQVKVALLMILSMLVVLSVSNSLIYKFTLDAEFNMIRNHLKSIAQMTAWGIDPDLLQQVPLREEGLKSSAYRHIADQLRKVKDANPHIKYVYTMKKTDKHGIWQFIVDPDPVERKAHWGDLTSYPGDTYDASRFPEMMAAFDGPSVDKNFEVDEWAVTLSGYAPIRDREGRAVAIVGVDAESKDVYLMQREVYRRTIFVLVLGILICFLVGARLAWSVTSPVEELIEGTRVLARGDLDHRVTVKGDDEISELASSFNDMAQSLGESRKRIINYFYDVVRSLVLVMEARDHYTRGHSEAVAELVVKIAGRMGFPSETVEMLKQMTLLHDIGKVGVQESILNKKDKLSPEEWAVIKQHPVIGEEILKPVLIDKEMLAVVRGHHERYDGNGYPDKLQGDQISIFASIVSVADAYHAMTSNRPYRHAMSRGEAIEELKKHKGGQFNPEVVDIFLQILREEKF